MRKKSEFIIVERALQTVDGFQKVFYTLQQQTILRGQNVSTLNNYIRQVALISLHFNQLPENIAEEEIKEYLTALAQSPKSPSRSSFKHAVYGLRYYFRHGKYLYPVRMFSAVFRGKMLEKLKRQLKQSKHLPQYQSLLDDLWQKPWVVYCEPPLGNSR